MTNFLFFSFFLPLFLQPMLCVSAVNPFLFSKVPALLHVMDIRKKIEAMLPYVRCPFRKVVQKSLGIRRYILESNDFFALRDLVDLSKGAFAGINKICKALLFDRSMGLIRLFYVILPLQFLFL